ncbi:hypothetical protein N7466_004438 [Penicillium verhagenii]|uniref:uncharacterized protein n=1 Tax=Penicillium verhagenii TaxID=1562060 RepID=UPI00254555AC|nr:uncharacterized protein N7466_004438 [Penicillium verhagenii]KAJ5934891.1 hypothetical protein N7466_004438 [Penicillium verhagenii]
METAHTRAVEALQPFIHLAKANSATSPRFVANLITNATSSPHTFVFAELLETPTIQSLSSPDTPAEYQSYLKLLQIFAWGTWQDYEGNEASKPTHTASTPNLPKLSFEQAQKLRLLSLLSLATTTKPLTYQSLMSALSLSTPGDLESLVTTAIYSSLITARLSPATTPATINVTSIAPLRDIQPHSLPQMHSLLTAWQARCGDVIGDLEAEIQAVKDKAAKRAVKEATHQRALEEGLERRKAVVGSGGDGPQAGSGRGDAAKRRGRRFWGMGNKREAEDIDQDDGFFDAGGDGMDIDEGAGAGGSGRGNGSRTKRILGRQG